MLKTSKFEPGADMGEGGISLCVPEIRGREWEYVKQCLDTNFVSSVGPFVDRFEQDMATYTGTKFGVATSTGTAALHITLLVTGIQPNDEVLVSTLTFIAPVNAIRYVGAWPVFIDADPDYWEMDPQKVWDFVEKDCSWNNGELRNRHTGRRLRAIMPVHILGHPVNMDPILEVARKFNLIVIEDATESLGAKYKGNKTGQLGDIACFSFNGNKIITTGGGGMIVTDNEVWASKAKYLSTQAKDDPLEYIHNEIGFNYRLTNIQAALGCAQLEQLEDYIAAKRRIAETYTDVLKDIPGLSPMQQADWAFSIFWMYTILIDETKFGLNSRSLIYKLAEKSIQARPFWQPVHLSKAHAGSYAVDCSVAEKLNREALNLPCSVGLTSLEQQSVLNLIANNSI